MGKSHIKATFPPNYTDFCSRYDLIFSATRLEFLEPQNFAKRPLHRSDSISREFRVVPCEHFHTSLMGNEEDAKGLLNIKQEFLTNHLLHLIVARMWQVVSLEKRRSGNEWLSAMLIASYCCTSKRVWIP